MGVSDNGRSDGGGEDSEASKSAADASAQELQELRRLLTEERERFAKLAESVPGAVYAYRVRPDQSTSFPFATAAIEQIYGVSREQLARDADIGARHIHPDDVDRVRASIEESARSLTLWRCEWRMQHPERGEIWVEGRSMPTREPDGGTIWYGIIVEITERKRAEEELRRSQELIERSQRRAHRIEALGTLAGGIAHEFNNILLTIAGNARLALADIPVDEQEEAPLAQCLREIEKASGRASNLVSRILAFSLQGESKREIITLEPQIEEAVRLLRVSLSPKIEITTDYADDAPPIIADPNQVQQIVMNLGTNASHAIGAGAGRIAITLERRSITAENRAHEEPAPGEYARITVRDTGTGMDPRTLERIFDPFYTTKPFGQGSGLGLSVAHGIMRSYGGAITVESEQGRGSTFRLYFPAAAKRAQESARPNAPTGSGQRVLYVDDEEPLVYLAGRVLERMGYTVVGATDPTQALQLFRQDPSGFDAVVSDLSMPGMSGFDLARELLAIRADTPILMTSGFVRPADRDLAREIGVRDLILKPDTIDELGRALGRIFKAGPS